MINTWYEYEDRQDGSFMFKHRTDDDELITEIYYGFNEVEAIKKFEKLIKEIGDFKKLMKEVRNG